MDILDARGFSCPEPVLMTKQALTGKQTLTVLVDNMTPVNNILRFAGSQGFKASYKAKGDDFEILISK